MSYLQSNKKGDTRLRDPESYEILDISKEHDFQDIEKWRVSQPRIIALTEALERDKQRFFAHGFDGYPGKPLQTDKFRVILENVKQLNRHAPSLCSNHVASGDLR